MNPTRLEIIQRAEEMDKKIQEARAVVTSIYGADFPIEEYRQKKKELLQKSLQK